jgi:hypothetical protein
MNPRHAAALALVGWYLMLPPTQEMFDPACPSRQASLMGTLKQLTRGTDANIIQCDVESLWLDTRAPLSKWDQARESFETLSACQAAKEKPLSEQDRRSAESIDAPLLVEDGAGEVVETEEADAQPPAAARDVRAVAPRSGHAQVDFGEALAVIGGVERKIHFFAMDLPHSDSCLVQAYPSESSEAFCEGHNISFEFFGGVLTMS